MENHFIAELESAAAITMAAPNVVTNDQRRAAEAIFLGFRKSKAPYDMCRAILEASRIPYVLFEAAETLKVALIREWTQLDEEYVTSMRNYLSQYVTSRELPVFVQDRLLQVIAIMVKRASIDDMGRERAVILNEVENLILNAEHPKKVIGCKILLNVMQEYASTVHSTDVGLPWEEHFKAKIRFEAGDIKRIFQFCLRVLSEIVNAEPPYDSAITHLLKYLLMIVEGVLTWGFISPMLPKRVISAYETIHEADQAPNLRLGVSWRPIMLEHEPPVVPLLFRVYWRVRDMDSCAHHALAALVQLASLNGAVLNDGSSAGRYVEVYMENFLKLVSSLCIRSKESIAISNIVRKMQIFHAGELVKLPKQLQESYIDEITRLTCSFAESAALEDGDTDDTLYADAHANLLEAWVGIMQQQNYYSSSAHDDPPSLTSPSTTTIAHLLHQSARRIFTAYVQCHLAPPDGRRQFQPDLAEVEDAEDADRVRYRSQLEAVGVFGRAVPGEALPILYKLLEDRTLKLKRHLHTMQMHTMTINDAASLDNLFEDLHWVTLVAGHTLCMTSEGETPLIPAELMLYSNDLQKKGEVDLDATLATLGAVNDVITDEPTATSGLDRCDHVVRIVAAVLRLCVLETTAAQAKLGHFMSPELGSTMMWFLKRACLSYLMPVETFYSELSPIFVGTLGKDTEGSIFVLNFILVKIQSNVCHFTSEPILLKDTVDLFAEIVCIKEVSIHITKSSALWELVNMQSKAEAGTLPGKVRRGLYKAFTLAGHSLDEAAAATYYGQIVRPPQQAFRQLVCQEQFVRIYQEEHIRKQVIDILEAFTGIAKGCLISTSEILYDYLAPVLSELPVFLNLYHNYQVIVQLILELFCQVAKYNLCYLQMRASLQFYENTAALVRAFAKCNENRFTAAALEEEEASFQDLALVMDLLTFILSKDSLDLSPESAEEPGPNAVTAADVSLLGLNFIMPLMTLDLLKYPSLCTQYYKLIVLINDIYPEKICRLGDPMLGQLLASVEVGLTQFGADIVQASLDFIHGLVSYVYRHGLQGSGCYVAAERFLPLLLQLALERQINSDMLEATSAAVYVLISCYRYKYDSLVGEMIGCHRGRDPTIGERLRNEFTKLTHGIQMNCDRQGKIAFRTHFKQFVIGVQGFLLLK